MPTYDLTCRSCDERFERFVQRLLKDEDKVCPACGSCDVATGFGGGVLGAGTSTSTSDAAACGTGGFT
jgi:putative FmdB family regulatory protein